MASVQPTYRQITGVVISAGKMMKTVKVQVPKQKWNKHIQKVYIVPFRKLYQTQYQLANTANNKR
jgi:ribosomal protein S17